MGVAAPLVAIHRASQLASHVERVARRLTFQSAAPGQSTSRAGRQAPERDRVFKGTP
jgi:hypothetical protein